MTAADAARQEQALDWARQIHDPSFAEWDAHIAWLEADIRNAQAFDDAVLTIESQTEGLAAPAALATAPRPSAPPVNDNDRDIRIANRRWDRRWAVGLGGAIAAGFAAILAVPPVFHGSAQPYQLIAAPGQSRDLTLPDGTSVALNGGSVLALDRAAPRTATLVKGQAFFRVVHDAARPFTVQADGRLFQDVGTSFDLVRDPGGVRLAVREGAVMYDPKGAALRLDGGQQIAFAKGGATIGPVDPAAVGGWKQGRLSYRDATLTMVAGDLSRSIGSAIAVDPSLQDKRFSGVLMIDGDREGMLRRIAAVMDVRFEHRDNGWQMTPNRP
jgi:transmembrane sensor